MSEKTLRLVVVIPSGRKRYMELLVPQILKQRAVVDELRLWVNTLVEEDLAYMEALRLQHPDLITLEYLHPDTTTLGTTCAISHFFKNAQDPGTVYIRLDDDVVWMEDDHLKQLYSFRVAHPEYYLVFGNIVNNAVCDHIHQQLGIYPPEPVFEMLCLDPNGQANPELAEMKHRTLLSNIEAGNLERYKFLPIALTNYDRVSINSIAWLGSEFHKADGYVAADEEHWLAVHMPKQLSKPNCLLGTTLCSHFAFGPQREHMDQTDVLDLYRALIRKGGEA